MATRGTPKKLPIPEAPKKWVIRWGDHVLREQEMTLGDCETIEKLTGRNWRFINPASTAAHAVAVVATMVARIEGRPEDEVLAEVRAAPNTVFFDAFDVEEDDLPAQYENGNPTGAVRPTATSRGSVRGRGTGRQK